MRAAVPILSRRRQLQPYSMFDPAAGGGGGSVTVDVFGTPTTGAPIFQSSSNNFNKTPINITAGLTNPGLVCALLRSDATNDVEAGVAVTWNGVPMTLIKKQNDGSTNNTVFLFGLLNPASGSQTLNMTATNSAADNFINCVSFSNVNPASIALAFPNAVSANNSNNIAVTSASGHISFGAGYGGVSTTILGTTIMNDGATGSRLNVMADYVVSSGASTTVGTTSNLQTSIVGMDISN